MVKIGYTIPNLPRENMPYFSYDDFMFQEGFFYSLDALQFEETPGEEDTKGPGVIVYLENDDEKVADVLDQVDVNVERLGIGYWDSRIVHLEKVQMDLTGVAFGRFPKLKTLALRWAITGINNQTFDGCTELESMYMGSPMDSPFSTAEESTSLYGMTKLKTLAISGYGWPKMGAAFHSFVENKQNMDKDFSFSTFV